MVIASEMVNTKAFSEIEIPNWVNLNSNDISQLERQISSFPADE